MSTNTLSAFSNELASIVDAAAPSVVQVHGHRRAVSGLALPDDVIVTMVNALRREDDLRVRKHDGTTVAAELRGWDMASGIAVLTAAGLGAAPATPDADDAPRTGHIAVAIARSWSNAVTASVGTIAVIGGPLPTGRRRSIPQIIRTTARMHDGFAGGAFVATSGRVIGLATGSAIRGLGVILPAPIVWHAASEVLKHGRPRRGYLGVAGQPATLAARQREAAGRDYGLLLVGITADGPADKAGLLVGDILVDVAGQPVASAEDVQDLLTADRVGQSVPATILRGGAKETVTVAVAERTS
jgi:S1-C subfamily serine protease